MTGALVARVLAALEAYYDAKAPPLDDGFLTTDGGEGAREVVLVRENLEEDGGLEIRVCLPRRVTEAQRWSDLDLDDRCQVVEGMSHFLLLCERARGGRSTSQLELEVQAEIDKWVVLSNGGRLPADADESLRGALYDDVHYVSPDERYRTANAVAARLTHRFAAERRGDQPHELRRFLRRFFRAGQEEKLRMALLG